MRINRRDIFRRTRWTWLPAVFLSMAGAALLCAGELRAQEALVYSFEADTEGFAPNGGGIAVEQDTIGATDGTSSLKVSLVSGANFVGALTSNLHPAIGNPGDLGTGINQVLFDLTITAPFGPPPPAPPGFAVVGVTIFAQTEDGATTGIPVQFRHEFHVDGLAAGTYPVQINLVDAHTYDPLHLNDNFSFNEIFGDIDTMVPTGFQFFFNKTGSLSNHPLTVYIDNVRVRNVPEVPGDYNGNGTVDAADYVLWRGGGPLANEVADPGTVSPADYDEWRARFGNISGSGRGLSAVTIPEPATALLVVFANMCWWGGRTGRSAVR